MDSKLLIGVSISAIAIIGLVSILMLEGNLKNSLDVDEIDSLDKPYLGGSSFSGGNMEFYEKWCVENKGNWNKSEDRCGFETEEDHKLASVTLDKLEHPDIGGDTAQTICQFLDIPCPDHAVFPGYYVATEDKTLVSYEYKGTKYRFDVTEPEIKYMIGDNPQWFDLGSKLKSDEYCSDNFVISLSTTKKFYFPGDEIVISGSVNCTFDDKRAVPNDIPITLQIISNDDLVEVAQIEITSDGKFSHLVNAMGPRWQQSGEYTVKTFYGTGYVAETNFEFFADVDPKSKNELQSSHNRLLQGDTVTIFGNIDNPAVDYVVIRIFDANNNEMENSRNTLNYAGFYSQEFKIKSNWSTGRYSASIMPSEFDSIVYFDVLGTEEIWGETSKEIQNFP